MWIGGTARGNVVRFRSDVSNRIGLTDCIALAGPDRIERELTYLMDGVDAPPYDGILVESGTAAGDELLSRLASEGMPAGLAAMGFTGARDLWPPWCAAVSDGSVVSATFAARISALGAEAGVATAREGRGRGVATAVTAAWAAHPALADRARFYTTAVDNHASRRVAEHLGLRLLGPTISVP